MTDIQEIAKEFISEFGVEQLHEIKEADFYLALNARFKIWRAEYNAMVGAWSESVNVRKRANSGIL